MLVDGLVIEHRIATQQVQSEEIYLDKARTLSLALQEIQSIIQHLAQATQQRAHQRISEVVTSCLNAVFQDPYEFRIVFERKRGKTEAKLVFVRNELVLDDPLNEVGGGVIDVAAFALRLSAILLSRPLKRKLIIMDEPFKNIRGKGNKDRTRQMLLKIAKEMKMQIIVNTEIPSYQLGTIVDLSEE